MRFSKLDDWLQWQQECHPSAIDLGLERVSKVAQTLGLLRTDATVVTVAGTNGKGSCVAALEAMAMQAKLRVGAFTSPHLLRYNERVQINGSEATDDVLCQAFDAIDQARGETSLTYFEFSTLAALYLFQQRPLDLWVLEVGLGGRLDATNIVDADLAIVTSIDIDHVEWLGDNREAIGREKAGILREQRPAICADANPPNSLLNYAAQLGVPLSLLGEHFGYHEKNQQVVFWSGEEVSAPVTVGLPKASLAAAFHASHLLQLGGVADAALTGLSLPGRMQRYHIGNKTIILDVAHNPAATASLARQLAPDCLAGPAAAVVAMMADKNIELSLAPLGNIIDRWAVCTIAGLPRAAGVTQIEQALPEHQHKCAYSSVAQALTALVQEPDLQLIVVTGSFYTVAEAQKWLAQQRSMNEAAG